MLCSENNREIAEVHQPVQSLGASDLLLGVQVTHGRSGPEDPILSWHGRLPGTLSEITYTSGVLCTCLSQCWFTLVKALAPSTLSTPPKLTTQVI